MTLGPYFIIFFYILDLVPRLAHLYFQEKLPVTLSYVQAVVLLYIDMLGQDISCIHVWIYRYFFSQTSFSAASPVTHKHITKSPGISNQPKSQSTLKELFHYLRCRNIGDGNGDLAKGSRLSGGSVAGCRVLALWVPAVAWLSWQQQRHRPSDGGGSVGDWE